VTELELTRHMLASEIETVYLGGGTPTFTEPRELARLLATLPAAPEVTVEANPETVTPALAGLLRDLGVTRISLGAQSFRPHLLAVLERRARPEHVRRALYHLRDANFDNISIDLIYGIPGQSTSDLESDLADALALEPEHLSCYELEAKPGTRFTHVHGAQLARQAEAMEGYFELVVERLTASGYRWYETANFCRSGVEAGGRDLRSRHNLAYWLGRDYLGLGVGAVSTVSGERWRTTPRLSLYQEALARGERPPRETEPLPAKVRAVERVLLGLRLDEPLPIAGLADVLDQPAVQRLRGLGLVREEWLPAEGAALALTARGRRLGGGVTAALVAG
jgi:putative oxygen-independent coproporphyrinogen III oxidase